MIGHIEDYNIKGIYSKEEVIKALHFKDYGTYENKGQLYFNGIAAPKAGKEGDCAESVILNGVYDDLTFDENNILYIGEGGLGKVEKKTPLGTFQVNEFVKDQEAETFYSARNQAMINSYNKGWPIRVIIGPNFSNQKINNLGRDEYLYFGVFVIKDYKYEKDESTNDCLVYQFSLERIK